MQVFGKYDKIYLIGVMRIMKKKIILIGISSFVILGFTIPLIISNYANKEKKHQQEPSTTNNLCKEDDGYCVHEYNGKEYLVLNNGYDNEYDIQYFDINVNLNII